MSLSPPIVDIDTGLMICNASHENIFLSELNVSGKPSESHLTNYWIRAPPLGGGDHVTPKRLAVHIRWSLGAEVFFRCPSDRTSICYHRLVLLCICAYYTSSSSSVSLHHLSTHRTLS